MKKKLILVTVGVLVVLWAFASLVYDKFKIIDKTVTTTIHTVEDSANAKANRKHVSDLTTKTIQYIDSLKKAQAAADSLRLRQ